jgi:Zn finger protein HypA/HybF involved in hydrogenase expression
MAEVSMQGSAELDVSEVFVEVAGIIYYYFYKGTCYSCDHEWVTGSPKIQCPECGSRNLDLETAKIIRIFLL